MKETRSFEFTFLLSIREKGGGCFCHCLVGTVRAAAFILGRGGKVCSEKGFCDEILGASGPIEMLGEF